MPTKPSPSSLQAERDVVFEAFLTLAEQSLEIAAAADRDRLCNQLHRLAIAQAHIAAALLALSERASIPTIPLD